MLSVTQDQGHGYALHKCHRSLLDLDNRRTLCHSGAGTEIRTPPSNLVNLIVMLMTVYTDGRGIVSVHGVERAMLTDMSQPDQRMYDRFRFACAQTNSILRCLLSSI